MNLQQAYQQLQMSPVLRGDATHASAGDLKALKKALRTMGDAVRKGSVGTVLQGQAYSSSSGSELAPLILQSIDPILHSETVAMEHLTLWPRLTSVNATSKIHETTVVSDIGFGIDPSMAEGSVGTEIEQTIARRIVEIKLFSVRQSINDFAATMGVSTMGGYVDRGMLATKTQLGIQSLMTNMDLHILTGGDSELSPLNTDSLYKQVYTQNDGSAMYTAGVPRFNPSSANYLDNGGAAVTPQLLIERLAVLAQPPTPGYPDTIFCHPDHYGQLKIEALSFQRDNDMGRALQSGKHAIVFGPAGLFVSGPRGPVEIVQTPLLVRSQAPPTSATGVQPASWFGSMTGPTAAAGSANSQFLPADAGAYRYKIQAVGDRGETAVVNVNAGAAVSVASGQKVSIDVQEIAAGASQGATSSTATTGSIRYFRVYRSDKDGSLASCKYLFSYPANTSGAGANGTLIVDENYHRSNTAPMIAASTKPQIMYWAKLMDMIRRPLYPVDTTLPFLLMHFGALHVRIPSHCGLIDNVQLSAV